MLIGINVDPNSFFRGGICVGILIVRTKLMRDDTTLHRRTIMCIKLILVRRNQLFENSQHKH